MACYTVANRFYLVCVYKVTLSAAITSGLCTLISQGAVLFDGMTGISAVNAATNSGNTFMGQALSLDATNFAADGNKIGGIEIGVVNATGADLNNPLRLNVWIYESFDGSAVSPTPVFSNQVGTPGMPSSTFNFGTASIVNSSSLIGTVTFDTPFTVNPALGTTIGMVFNWQMDLGAGFVNIAGLTTAIRGGPGLPAPSVGSNATGSSPNFGYYRNAGGEVNGNFLSASGRSIGENSGLYLRVSGIPEPSTSALGLLAATVLLCSRRRTKTV